jgi:acetyltransferase
MPADPAPSEQVLRLRDGVVLSVRSLVPDDASALVDLFDHLTPEDVRARFLVGLRALPPRLLERLSHPDRERELALAAFHPDLSGSLCGVARLAIDADDRNRAEFAVAVRSDWKRRGLGRALLEALIRGARARGIGELRGEILGENAPMIALARKLGFAIAADPRDATLVIARLRVDG